MRENMNIAGVKVTYDAVAAAVAVAVAKRLATKVVGGFFRSVEQGENQQNEVLLECCRKTTALWV